MAKQNQGLLEILKARFQQNMARHEGLEWEPLKERLQADGAKLQALGEMEKTGGEPDVVGYDSERDEYLFCDCSAESPSGRRNLCYDRQALDARKQNKPQNSAVELAETMVPHC